MIYELKLREKQIISRTTKNAKRKQQQQKMLSPWKGCVCVCVIIKETISTKATNSYTKYLK